ncbi:hypothetical protein Tco_1570795 [Tanacetum coccineum]
MYENFSASSQDSLNFKFLRSLPSKWDMHVVVRRNKPDLGKIRFDDLYNNFKIVEQDVKRINTASTNVSTASINDSTANLSDATIYAFLANQPNGSQVVHEYLKQIHKDDLEEIDLKWQLGLLSLKKRKFYQRTGLRVATMVETKVLLFESTCSLLSGPPHIVMHLSHSGDMLNPLCNVDVNDLLLSKRCVRQACPSPHQLSYDGQGSPEQRSCTTLVTARFVSRPGRGRENFHWSKSTLTELDGLTFDMTDDCVLAEHPLNPSVF